MIFVEFFEAYREEFPNIKEDFEDCFISLNTHLKANAENFFRKFGLHIKKFSISGSDMHEEHLHAILDFMPNLVELRLCCEQSCERYNFAEATPGKSLKFTKLERIHLVDSKWKFIDQLSCHSLKCFSFE